MIQLSLKWYQWGMLVGNALEWSQELPKTVNHWNRYIFPLLSILKPTESSTQKEDSLLFIEKGANSIANQG